MTEQKPRGRGGAPVPEAKLADFLSHLAETGDVSVAAEHAGLRRSTLYKKRGTDAAFARRWAEALDQGLDRLQDHAVNRATVGVEKAVWSRGEQVGTVLQPDNRLLQFLLKAHRPDVYDRGRGAAAARPFDLARRMAEAEKRLARNEAELKKKEGQDE